MKHLNSVQRVARVRRTEANLGLPVNLDVSTLHIFCRSEERLTHPSRSMELCETPVRPMYKNVHAHTKLSSTSDAADDTAD